MPRKPRLFVDGGYYHVIARGNNKLYLLNEDNDFYAFIDILRRARIVHLFKIHHYCLMSNHIHMLLQLENGRHLPRIMQRVLFGYVRYYKKKMKYVGHLWQGRYKCLLIGKESYLLECGRYIERNPLRAGMVQRLDDYRWSSYVYYANGKPDDLIEPNPYYEQMGFNPEERQSNYRDFVRLENPYSGIIDQTLIQKHF